MSSCDYLGFPAECDDPWGETVTWGLARALVFLLWILSVKRLPVWGLCSKPKLPFDVTIPLYLLQSMVVIIVIKDFYRNTFGAGGTQIHSHYQILLGKIVCTFGPPALIFFFLLTPPTCAPN